MSGPVGEALHELVPEPPRELSMTAFAAARTTSRRRHALAATGAALAVIAVAVPIAQAARPGPGAVQSFGSSGATTVVADVSIRHPATWRLQDSQSGLPWSVPGIVTVERTDIPTEALTGGGYQVSEVDERLIGTRERTDDENCRAAGGAELVSAVVRLGTSVRFGGWSDVLRVEACLTGPDLETAKAQVVAMLASAEVG